MKYLTPPVLWYIPVMLLIASCDTGTEMRNQLRLTNAELREMKRERDEARTKVQSLYEQIEQMQNQYLDKIYTLEAGNKDLLEFKHRNNRLESALDEQKLRYSELKE